MADMTLSVKITGDSSSLIDALNSALGKLDDVADKVQGVDKKISTITWGQGFKQLGGAITNVGNGLTNNITKPALDAGKALGGMALGKGWSRMAEMDTAKAKLKAIGLTAEEVQTVSDQAYQSIAGSAFAMDEAMTVASQGIAGGLQAGSDAMQQYMDAITGVASYAGTSMTDMSMIFGKVMAKDKATQEDLNMLAERAVPIYQWLAEEMDMSMEQVMKAASDGKVHYEDFANAVYNHTQGMADAIGTSTIPGALSFIDAGLAKIGQAFWGAGDDASTIAGKVIPLIMSVYKAMDPVIEKARELGQSIAEKLNPIIDQLIGFLDRFSSGTLTDADKRMVKLVTTIGSIAVAAGPVIGIIGKLISGMGGITQTVGFLSGSFGNTGMSALKFFGSISKIAGVAGLLIASLVGMYQNSESFREAVNNLVSTALQSLMAIFEALQPAISALLEALQPMLSLMGDALAPVIDIISIALQLITPLIVVIVDLLAKLLEWLTPLIQEAAEFAAGLSGPISEAFDAVSEKISAVIDWFSHLSEHWAEFKENAKETWEGVKEAVVSTWEGIKTRVGEIWEGIKTTLSEVWEQIKETASNVFQTIFDVITLPMRLLIEGIQTLWDGAKTWLSEHWDGIKETASRVFQTIFDVVTAPTRLLIDGIKTLWQGAKETITGIWDGIKERATNAWDSIRDKITGPIEDARDTISGIIDKIKGWFPIKLGNIFSNIKLPSFDLDWRETDVLGKTFSYPAGFNLSWNAKGGIFSQPSVIGVGEAGPEAVTPIDKLKSYIAEAVTNANTAQMDYTAVDSLADAITSGFAMQNAGTQGGEYRFIVELGGARVAEKIFTLNKQGEMIMQGA